jgi:hypothetical protein
MEVLPRRRFRPGAHRHRRRPAQPQALDQKLWVALSCPTKGIEFDARTLELLDSDADGHIRAPELLAAIDWAARLATRSPCSNRSWTACRWPRSRTTPSSPPRRACCPDGGAMISVDAASAAEAEYTARALAAWEASGNAARPLGDATEAACAALAAVKDKLDDFFVRCRLAAFDERAGDAMNASDDSFKALGGVTLSNGHADIAALPLARVGAGATVPLGAGIDSGINPAWAERIGTLREAVVVPLLGARPGLSESDWLAVQDQLAVYSAWQAAKPAGLPPEAEAVRDLERLARYVRDLLPLANNFRRLPRFLYAPGQGHVPDRHPLPRRPLRRTLRRRRRRRQARGAGRTVAHLPGVLRLRAQRRKALDRRRLHRRRFRPVDGAAATASSTTARAATGTPPSPRSSTIRSACARPSGRPTRSSRAWSANSCRSSPRARPPAVEGKLAETAAATAKKADAAAKPRRAAGLRRRQVRRHLRRHRPGRRRHRHRRGLHAHRPARPALVADSDRAGRPDAADIRPRRDRRLVQAAGAATSARCSTPTAGR